MKVKRTALAAILVVFAVLGVYPGAGQNKNALPNEARLVPAIILPDQIPPMIMLEEEWNAAASTRVYLRENGVTREIRFHKGSGHGFEYDAKKDAYVQARGVEVSVIYPDRYSVAVDGEWKEYYLDANRFLQPK